MPEESDELLMINTYIELFQYTRLPFGLKSAPAIFQQIMDTMLQGIAYAIAYVDDVIIIRSNQNELHQCS